MTETSSRASAMVLFIFQFPATKGVLIDSPVFLCNYLEVDFHQVVGQDDFALEVGGGFGDEVAGGVAAGGVVDDVQGADTGLAGGVTGLGGGGVAFEWAGGFVEQYIDAVGNIEDGLAGFGVAGVGNAFVFVFQVEAQADVGQEVFDRGGSDAHVGIIHHNGHVVGWYAAKVYGEEVGPFGPTVEVHHSLGAVEGEMQPVDVKRRLAAHEPHIHQEQGQPGDMVWMKVGQDDIGDGECIQTGFFETDDRVGGAVNQHQAFRRNQCHVGIFVIDCGDRV